MPIAAHANMHTATARIAVRTPAKAGPIRTERQNNCGYLERDGGGDHAEALHQPVGGRIAFGEARVAEA